MELKEFQEELLNTQKQVKTSVDDLTKNFGNLQTETKQAFEDLHKVQKQNDDLDAKVSAVQRVQASLKRELKLANGDSIRSFLADEDARNQVRSYFIHKMGPTFACAAKGIIPLKEMQARGTLVDGSSPGSLFIPNASVEKDFYNSLLTYGAFKTVDVRSVPVGKAVEIPVKTARVLFQFVDEDSQISADATKAGSRLTVTPKKIAALVPISRELLEDNDLGLMADLMEDFAEGFGLRMDYLAFAADASSAGDDGGFTGMFAGGTAVTAASATTVGAMAFTDVLKCLTGIDPAVLQRASTRWWIHPTIIAKMLSIVDSNGRPIFLNALEAPSYGGIGSIFGYAVTPAGAAPSTDSAAKLVAAFGDGNAMALRLRRDLEISTSEHFNFDKDEYTFRATARVGARVKKATAIAVLKTHA